MYHNHSTDRHPINCILPPHMLEQIAANGSDDQRTRAMETQALTLQMRKERNSLSG